jgi:putative tryptophan/tyrosine transport system substrate-binding protein
MRRREFIAGLGGAAVAWPVAARAQQRALPVIGFLSPQSAEVDYKNVTVPFLQGLKEAGHVEGQNVAVEHRYAENQFDRLPALAADLVHRRVAVIVASGSEAALAAKAATTTVPIVFGTNADPVALGLVASLNRPGANVTGSAALVSVSGNLTGVTGIGAELAGKRLELLHKLVPAADTIAMLVRQGGSAFNQAETRAMQSAADVLGVRLLVLYAATESEVATAFATLIEQHASALVTSSNAFSPAEIDQIISLAGRYAVPTLFINRTQVARGGLASYGGPISELFRQMGVYTGRILKGEKPADLPIMQPTKFELVINLKTAKALGLTIPETLLAIADEVIQ